MPAVQCLRGMNSPANGIFFRRRAALMLGRRRQETRCGRPRALPPPFPPEGAARRGGSKDREQSKGATGRTALMRVGSARADGRSLRGSGSVFEQRQDVMRRRTAAGEGCPGMAAGTTAGIVAGFVFTAWPANGPVAPAIVAPAIAAPAIAAPAIAAPDGGVPAFRRCPDSVPPIRPVRGLWTMRREERRRNIRASVRRERLPSGKPSEYSRLRPSPGGANPVFRGPFDAR